MTNALHFVPRVPVEVAYPKDSIIVCLRCGKPLYRLQASIYLGEHAGKQSNWKYAPVEVKDIVALMERTDIEPGQRAALKALSLADWQAHCDQIPTLPKDESAGERYSECPSCKEPFLFGQIRNDQEGASRFGDKGYIIRLAMIPPQGQARRRA